MRRTTHAAFRRGPPNALRDMLSALATAHCIDELRMVPGWQLDALKGELAGRWTLTVTRGCWLIFRFEDGDAFDLDLVDAPLKGAPAMAMKIPPHIGGFIRRQIIEALNLTVTDAAAALGVTRQALNNLLNEKAALTAEMALRIEKAFGPKADHLMRMQLAYDMAQVRQREATINVQPGRVAPIDRSLSRKGAEAGAHGPGSRAHATAPRRAPHCHGRFGRDAGGEGSTAAGRRTGNDLRPRRTGQDFAVGTGAGVTAFDLHTLIARCCRQLWCPATGCERDARWIERKNSPSSAAPTRNKPWPRSRSRTRAWSWRLRQCAARISWDPDPG